MQISSRSLHLPVASRGEGKPPARNVPVDGQAVVPGIVQDMGTKKGSTAGAPLTGGSSGGDLLGPLKFPTAESVAQDRKAVTADLRMLLGDAGIPDNPPIHFTVAKFDGHIEVDPGDPRAGAVRDVLNTHPELSRQMAEVIYHAQMSEHAQAVEGWFSQVGAGRSPIDADRDLLNASQRIFDDNGFCFGDGEFSTDVEGVGKQLMPRGPVPPSDDQKLWREMLLLTERVDTRKSAEQTSLSTPQYNEH